MTIERSPRRLITDGGTAPGRSGEAPSRRERLELITQATRASLVQNVLGHKWMMPSKKELDYYNPSKDPSTISGHVEKLVDKGIFLRATVPQGQRAKGLPNTFFTLTDTGFALLADHSLFLPNWEEIREDHRRVDKTAEIERYEAARRPTINVSYPHPLKGDGISVVDPAEYANEPIDEIIKELVPDDGESFEYRGATNQDTEKQDQDPVLI